MVPSVRVANAVLMNPPVGSGSATLRRVDVARTLLKCEALLVTNLFNIPTRSVLEIADEGRRDRGWTEARRSLVAGIETADEIVLAWGLGGFSGRARTHFRAQVQWLGHQLMAAGVETVWMVGGEPRHPSRWHQFVSDRHGRTTGGAFHERLSQVLRPAAVRTLIQK